MLAAAGCALAGTRVARDDRAAAAPDDRKPAANGVRPCPATDASGVVQHVNDVRRRAGLRALDVDTNLGRIATTRSATMAAERRLSHQGWERALRKAGLRDDSLGENVAYNYEDPTAVMTGWMRSPGHRANILRQSFTRIGVGCVIDGRGHRWWTQDFAG